MEQETYIPTPTEIGHDLVGHLIFFGGKNRPVLLATLLYLVGVSKADLAKMTGLTRGRINHYANYGDPVPDGREFQFYHILRNIVEAWERDLAALDERPEDFEASLVPEAVPVARAIVTACRKVLAAEKARVGA